MKAVLISTRPQWCEKIASGKKTIEVRKTAPKCETPFKCYIYCTKDRKNLLPIEHGKVLQKVNFWKNTDAYYGFGKVIGEFICDKITEWKYLPDYEYDSEKIYYINSKDGENTCLSYDEIEKYGKGKPLYGWHISDLKIYDKPKELSEFISSKPKNKFRAHGDNLTRPPQSWIWVEDKNE